MDDVEDAVNGLATQPSEARREILADAVDAAELAISRATNAYPDDADLLRSEARLRDLLGDGADAIQLLEKAWARTQRGSGVAKQLARRHVVRGDFDKALETLNAALEREPTERSLNRLIAEILFTQTGDLNDAKAVNHLVASFVSGDREHWGRFLRASHAYAIGEFAEGMRLFEELDRRAPENFRPRLKTEHAWLSAAMIGRRGMVAKSFGAYVLITPTIGPDRLYTPSRETDADEWEKLAVRSEVVWSSPGSVDTNRLS